MDELLGIIMILIIISAILLPAIASAKISIRYILRGFLTINC